MRVLLNISYDGKNYYGFQRQPNEISIQEVLEKAIMKITKTDITVHGSGRTDAKVHAYNQYVHFDTSIENVDWKKAINSHLPLDVHIKNFNLVDDNFHSRFSCKSKTYVYKINVGEYDPLLKDYAFYPRYKFDIDELEKQSKYLIGEHDFKHFTKVVENKSTVRTIYDIDINQKDNLLLIRFKGNGFLRYQIRYMVGTLLYIAKTKKYTINDVFNLEEKGNYVKNIDPQGLYLDSVEY